MKRGLKIDRETRNWDAVSRTTKTLRMKESEEDYGYIFDPDLCPIEIEKEYLLKTKNSIPELPSEKIKRFISQYKISDDNAEVLSSDIFLANLFEDAAKECSPNLCAKWLRRELLRVLNYAGKTIKENPVKKERIIELFKLLENNLITEKTGQRIMKMLVEKDFSPKEFVSSQHLDKLEDKKEIEEICREIIKENKKAVEDFKSGKKESFNYLFGQVMKKTSGKAEPSSVRELLNKLLKNKEYML